jgi:hypothetical protein
MVGGLIPFVLAGGGGDAIVWVSELAGRLIAILIILGCLGLGGLIGYLLAELASVNLFFTIAGSMTSITVFIVLFGIVRWNGLFSLPGAMAAAGYAGAVTAAVMRISIILGRPLWLGAIMALVCVVLGLYLGIRTGESQGL